MQVDHGDRWTLFLGDNRHVFPRLAPDSVDAFVMDPPAGIAFMGKEWDKDHGGRDQWIALHSAIFAECLRVAKPGAYALVWGLPRTSHWTALALENAGWEIRDVVNHLFGQGFPKSYNVAKGIEGKVRTGSANWSDWKGLGGETYPAKTGYVRLQTEQGYRDDYSDREARDVDLTTPEAQAWRGWGTALKPAVEHWILCRKPLAGSVVDTVLTYGTGALNIGACKVDTTDYLGGGTFGGVFGNGKPASKPPRGTGRWPANLVLSHPTECQDGCVDGCPVGTLGDDLARFFYTAKASARERDLGLDDVEPVAKRGMNTSPREYDGQVHGETLLRNHHPTVKPLSLMRYLCRLVTPPDGLVVDPFTGSGTTGMAAMLEGFRFLGMEGSAEYWEIARRRIRWASEQPRRLL